MKTVFTLFFTFFLYVTNGQSILVSPVNTNVHVMNADLSDNYLDFMSTVEITNESADTLWIIWRREFIAVCPIAWDLFVSDIWNDFLPHINTNYDPSIGLNGAYSILPGQTEVGVYSFLYPQMAAGCCEVAFHFSEINNPDSTLATAYIDYKINDPDCTLVGSFEELEKEVKVFPNPTNGQLYIESEKQIQAVAVFNAQGEMLINENNFTEQFDINGLPKGIYFLKIKLAEEDFFWKKIEKF